MIQDVIPAAYQVFCFLIPTISLIGNSIIVHVTIRSTFLRSPCNIFIGLISFGDVLHMTEHYVMIISHSVKFLILEHKYLYVAVQTLIAVIFALFANVLVLLTPLPEHDVLCVITEPLQGMAYQYFVQSIMIISVTIVICYVIFLCLIRKVRLGEDNMKHIYRSLIVISLTVVFGWFSTMFIVYICDVLYLDIERFYVNLLAGLFVNFACATSFFVYYAVRLKADGHAVQANQRKEHLLNFEREALQGALLRKVVRFIFRPSSQHDSHSLIQEYRRIFDQYLFTGRFKNSVSAQSRHMAMAMNVNLKDGSYTQTPDVARTPHSG